VSFTCLRMEIGSANVRQSCDRDVASHSSAFVSAVRDHDDGIYDGEGYGVEGCLCSEYVGED
jgi:hypothetical protein